MCPIPYQYWTSLILRYNDYVWWHENFHQIQSIGGKRSIFLFVNLQYFNTVQLRWIYYEADNTEGLCSKVKLQELWSCIFFKKANNYQSQSWTANWFNLYWTSAASVNSPINYTGCYMFGNVVLRLKQNICHSPQQSWLCKDAPFTELSCL